MSDLRKKKKLTCLIQYKHVHVSHIFINVTRTSDYDVKNFSRHMAHQTNESHCEAHGCAAIVRFYAPKLDQRHNNWYDEIDIALFC